MAEDAIMVSVSAPLFEFTVKGMVNVSSPPTGIVASVIGDPSGLGQTAPLEGTQVIGPEAVAF